MGWILLEYFDKNIATFFDVGFIMLYPGQIYIVILAFLKAIGRQGLLSMALDRREKHWLT